MNKKFWRHGHLWLGMALLAAPAVASEGQVEYRQHVMAAVGGHMQAAADILKQKVTHADHLALHADGLADMAGIAHTLFPEGSQGGDALEDIWENPDDFADKVSAFETAASDFQAAVAADDGIMQAFQQVGQACKSCHDDYRAE